METAAVTRCSRSSELKRGRRGRDSAAVCSAPTRCIYACVGGFADVTGVAYSATSEKNAGSGALRKRRSRYMSQRNGTAVITADAATLA
eukprot:363266-Chlamydomonas_euryale.AAC.4